MIRWIVGILIGIGVILSLALMAVVGALMWFHIPQNASGMAAETVCSAAFVSGRNVPAEQLMASDVLPASPVLSVISAELNQEQHTATATFLGLFPRTASLVSERGCVLDAAPDTAAAPYVPKPVDPRPWPQGDAALSEVEVAKTGADPIALARVLDGALVGSGDPAAANARGVAVVQGGKLIALRNGVGIQANTALHGWSMTKTVAAMLAWKKGSESGFDFNQPVVNAFPAGRAPAWVGDWQKDDRKNITVADLLFMRDGLKLEESYDPTGDVVQMLYGEQDMSAWSADHPLEFAPGTTWEYLSATSNILSAVTRGQFASDDDYVAYSKKALFAPIGLSTATLQTDTSGTWVASSYLWASTGDWARLGQLMLHDGEWQGAQVFPRGWLALASTPAVATGEGHGYGAQTWLPGKAGGGECAAVPGFPADTVSMEGHWGQLVAMIPSRDIVIVRLGWTFKSGKFDSCAFVRDVVATLPEKPAA